MGVIHEKPFLPGVLNNHEMITIDKGNIGRFQTCTARCLHPC